jgi:hypothetical protein
VLGVLVERAECPLTRLRGSGLEKSGRGLRIRLLYVWSFDCVGWGGAVHLREWSTDCVGSECFYRFITEVGGDDLPTSLV